MTECEFCKIAQKTHAAHIILEDVNFIAFLDVNPLVEGHTLIISKKHFNTVWDMYTPSQTQQIYYRDYMFFCARVANFLRKFYNQPVSSMVLEYEVKHACTHLIPNVNKGVGWVIGDFLKSKKKKPLTVIEGNKLIEKYHNALSRKFITL